MFSQDRDSMRRFFIAAWRKAGAGQSLEPLEALIVQVIRAHPEYHSLLGNEDAAVGREYPPEDSQTNPFLHLSLHLAVLEQASTDRPMGICSLYRQLTAEIGDAHEAEHLIMDCLTAGLWEAQRSGQPPQEAIYLDRVRRLVPRSRS